MSLSLELALIRDESQPGNAPPDPYSSTEGMIPDTGEIPGIDTILGGLIPS